MIIDGKKLKDKYFNKRGYFSSIEIAWQLGLKQETVVGWINRYNIPDKKFKYGEKIVYKFKGSEINAILEIIKTNIKEKRKNERIEKQPCTRCDRKAILTAGICSFCQERDDVIHNEYYRQFDMQGTTDGCYKLLEAIFSITKVTVDNYVLMRDSNKPIDPATIRLIKNDIRRAERGVMIDRMMSKIYLIDVKDKVPEFFT